MLRVILQCKKDFKLVINTRYLLQHVLIDYCKINYKTHFRESCTILKHVTHLKNDNDTSHIRHCITMLQVGDSYSRHFNYFTTSIITSVRICLNAIILGMRLSTDLVQIHMHCTGAEAIHLVSLICKRNNNNIKFSG